MRLGDWARFEGRDEKEAEEGIGAMSVALIVSAVLMVLGLGFGIFALREIVFGVLRLNKTIMTRKKVSASLKRGIILGAIAVVLTLGSFVCILHFAFPGPGVITTWKETNVYLKGKHGDLSKLREIRFGTMETQGPDPYYSIEYYMNGTATVVHAHYEQGGKEFIRFEEQ